MLKILDLKFRKLPLSIASFLLETSEGPVILETGPHSTLPSLKRNLKKYGYKMEDVKHVFLTHIHLDHAGAAWAFAEKGAMIYMHPFGEKHAIDPSKLYASAKMIYQDLMDIMWGKLNPIPKEKITITTDGQKFKIGDTEIISWHTPGHAVHHVAFQIGKSLIAGDVLGVKIGEKGMVVPPCPPPDINIDHWMNSIELIEKLDLEAVYLTHFGKVTDLITHYQALKFILLDWANWIRPYYDQKTDPNIVIPLFEKYTRQQLIDFGIAKKDLAAYENCNPTFMSVNGLLRYWQKKLEPK